MTTLSPTQNISPVAFSQPGNANVWDSASSSTTGDSFSAQNGAFKLTSDHNTRPTLSHPSPHKSVAILPSAIQTHRSSFSGQGQHDSRLPASISHSLSLQEMANQLGIPSRLPAPPGIGSTIRPAAPVIRTPPQPQQPTMAENEAPDFTLMLGNYLHMLGKQPASEPQHESPTAGTAALEDSGVNDEALRSLGSWLASAALPGSTSPAFTDIGDVSAEAMNDFLTSPLIDDSYEEFTSPLMDTPLLDFTSPNMDETSPMMSDLNTPLFQDHDGSFEDEPLIVDPSVEMYKQQQQHLQVPTSSVPKAPPAQLDYDNLLKMSPGNTPALQSFGDQFPSPAMSIDHSFSPMVNSTTSLPLPRPRRPIPTGTRRGITSASLISEDAPTQARHYATPSVTSRKDVPSTFRKRPRPEDDDGDELEEAPPPNATEKQLIEFKRRQNTLAARKSRKRKMEHLQTLESKVTRLTREVEQWKTRAEFLEGMCVSSGLLSPQGLGVIP